jgi:hypothetical protein
MAAIAARYRAGDGALQTLHRRSLKDEQPPAPTAMLLGFWLSRDALQVMRTHQARVINAIKLNEIIAWRAEQDQPNDTQRSHWNELRSPCSDSIADMKADATEVDNAVVLAVDDELVEVGAAPTQGDLDEGVQPGDSRRIRHQQPAPDQRADAVETDAELVDRSGIGGWTYRTSQPTTGQGAAPSKAGRGTNTTGRSFRKASSAMLLSV